ncbi:ABC transporter permease [Amaricoccus solimangrovi]|uniref:ABC transporter permease n=1 Tax=Amaricoccus solimangrovi TaxID=2589815 RepID=A0A501WMN3_9RHOB|nr:ABC transporter permease [Amaricoccus solimangrovi]TPE51033.1 ABC transporter permease [Amaricoccus solimangrovi]
MKGTLALALLVAAFLAFPEAFVPVLRPFAPEGGPVIYDRASLAGLTAAHVGLVALALLPSALIALGLAIWVTRPGRAHLLPLARAVVNFGQTLPPVAVLALCVPVFGFGAVPTLVALFLYGLLPIFESSLAGLSGVPAPTLTAATAMGLTPARRLLQVELPLAAPLILEGTRLSAVIALSTATIGSTVAARTLGEVIIAGLNVMNLAFVLQGGLLTAALALLIHAGFGALAEAARPPGARSSR